MISRTPFLFAITSARGNIMHSEPSHPAVAESYPTFWNDDAQTPVPVVLVVPPDEAYSAFVGLTEDELPECLEPGAESNG